MENSKPTRLMETRTSHTDQLANDIAATRQDIARLADINPEEIPHLVFDIGCRFVDDFARQFIPNRDNVKKNLLENSEWCFWNWWNIKWGLDDIAIMTYTKKDSMPVLTGNNALQGYITMKEAMVGDALLNKELYYEIYDKLQ